MTTVEVSQETLLGHIFVIIGLLFTALVSTSLMMAPISHIKASKVEKEARTIKGMTKSMAISTATYIGNILASIFVFLLFIFLYFVFFGENMPLGDTLAKSTATLKHLLWMDGKMLTTHITLIVSFVIVFAMVILYALSDKEFVKNLRFPILPITKNISYLSSVIGGGAEDENDDNEDGENVKTTVNDVELFRSHYSLLLFLVCMFIFMVMFVPMWDISKKSFAIYMFVIFGIIVTALATFAKWWSFVFVYALLLIGYLKSTTN